MKPNISGIRRNLRPSALSAEILQLDHVIGKGKVVSVLHYATKTYGIDYETGIQACAHQSSFPLELSCHSSYNEAVFIRRVHIHKFSSTNTAVQLSREFLIESPGEGRSLTVTL